MKQPINVNRQTHEHTVFDDIGHNPSVPGPDEGGLIDPIEMMSLDLPQAQQELPVVRMVADDSQSDRLSDDKRVANGSIAARPADFTIREPT